VSATLLVTKVMSFFLKVTKTAAKAGAGAVASYSRQAGRFEFLNERLGQLVWAGKNASGRTTQFFYSVAEDGRVFKLDNMANEAFDTGIRLVESAKPNLRWAYGAEGAQAAALEQATEGMGFFEICFQGKAQVNWVAAAPDAADAGSHALHYLQQSLRTMPGSTVQQVMPKLETVSVEARSVAPAHAPSSSNAPSEDDKPFTNWELFKNLVAPAYFSDPESSRQFWRRVGKNQNQT
jgi:hypothetical protein